VSVLWVHVEDLSGPGPIALAPDEARHVGARRLRKGGELVVFDGAGRHARARVEALGRRSTVVIAEAVESAPQPVADGVLATAIPKGDRLSTLLQMLTQLGVVVWQPLVLDESVVRKLDPASSRLDRILLESCKVARRPWRLEVRAPCRLDDVLAERPEGASVCFGDREGGPAPSTAAPAVMVIGPEAGLSESERRALRASDAQPVSLGPYNMRIETAAAAAALLVPSLRAGGSRGAGDAAG
jgi:16S rRNA (uracil1498-N3)-methyltransferase